MVANTDQRPDIQAMRQRVSSLCSTAIKLVTNGNRNEEQKQELFNVLNDFTTYFKLEEIQIKSSTKVYPGRSGRKCNGCGGWIDEGGFCNGKTDHWEEIPGACGKDESQELSIFDQLALLTNLCSETMKKIRHTQNLEQSNNLINALQAFKDGKSDKTKLKIVEQPGCFNGNRCTRCGGFIDEGGICPCGYDHDSQTDHSGM